MASLTTISCMFRIHFILSILAASTNSASEFVDDNISKRPPPLTTFPTTSISNSSSKNTTKSLETKQDKNQSYTTLSKVVGDSFAEATAYENHQRLYKMLFDPARYDPLVRPILGQDKPVYVTISLKVFKLISVDDIQQTMTIHANVDLGWEDELLRWKKSEFDIERINPHLEKIWFPRLLLYNSRDGVEILGGDNQFSPHIFNSGYIYWGFTNIFTSSCNLDLDKYPFDVQTCLVEIVPVINLENELQFTIFGDGFDLFKMEINYGWEITGTNTTVGSATISGVIIQVIEFSFTLKRKPTFILLNDILPMVSLCLLNCFVFLVPRDSGEKISFGISVLLAIAVYLSYASTKLPSATDGIPAVIVYLGCLFVNSIVTVILSIVNVQLDHYVRKRKEYKSPSSDRNKHPNKDNTYPPHSDDLNADKDSTSSATPLHLQETTHASRWMSALDAVLQYTDIVGFLVVTGVWGAMTIWFFTYVSS